ncbi:MAG: hypothetical protein AAF492_03770 [Verrucomicrobiota bacterium]
MKGCGAPRRCFSRDAGCWMRKKVTLAATVVSVLFFVTMRTDGDYCIYTAKGKVSKKVFSLSYHSTEYDTAISDWLKNEFQIASPVEFRDDMEYHPLFPLVSTPPGNWIFLRHLKSMYEKYERSRFEVGKYLKDLFETDDPKIDIRVYIQLQQKYSAR